MKKLATLCLAACLAAALATPAGALDYAIDAPEGPDYGKPTSVEGVSSTASAGWTATLAGVSGSFCPACFTANRRNLTS